MDGPTVDARVDGNNAGSCAAGACRRVFVTSATTNGGFGGLAMGDLFSQSLADASGLGGAFKAWLSDRATDAAVRLSHATVPYRLVDGTLVANDWNDLIDGTLAHAIDLHETGARAMPATPDVWTGTTRTGRTTSTDCTGWSSASAHQPAAGQSFRLTASTNSRTITLLCSMVMGVHRPCEIRQRRRTTERL